MNKKSVSYLLFLMICLVPFSVKAECSDEELKSLKEDANKIKIEYQENYNPQKEDFEVTDNYDEEGNAIPDEDADKEVVLQKATIDVIVSNYSDKFYILDEETGYKFDNRKIENGMLILKNQPGGKRKYMLYSNSCGSLVKRFTITLPRYNIYSEDPLCEGITGEQLSVCGTWYNYSIDYNTFVKRIEQYKKDLNKIDENNKKKEKEKKVEEIKEFFEEYYLYMIFGILVIICIIAFVIYRKKRSVLE